MIEYERYNSNIEDEGNLSMSSKVRGMMIIIEETLISQNNHMFICSNFVLSHLFKCADESCDLHCVINMWVPMRYTEYMALRRRKLTLIYKLSSNFRLEFSIDIFP